MVSSYLWTDFELIDSRLGEIFYMIPKKILACLSVMTYFTCFSYLQLEENLYFHDFLIKIE